MPRFRRTIADRIAEAEAQPIDPLDLISEGAMTVKEAVEFSGISASQMEAHISAQRIPLIRDGRSRKIPRKALKLSLAARLAFRKDLLIKPHNAHPPARGRC